MQNVAKALKMYFLQASKMTTEFPSSGRLRTLPRLPDEEGLCFLLCTILGGTKPCFRSWLTFFFDVLTEPHLMVGSNRWCND